MRSQMQHRASFLMLFFSNFIGAFVQIVMIWILFERFKELNGWHLYEVAIISGVVHMGFAVAECTAKAFDNFHRLVKSGDFDRILLRPCSTLLQVSASDFQAMRFGRFLQGFIILLWGASQSHIAFFSYQTVVIAFAVISTSALFYGLFVIQGALSFWIFESLEFMNIVTYGGVETGQYPLSIYNKFISYFFTVFVPIGCAAYYPIASVLHRDSVSLILGIIAPIAGLIFLFLSCKFWHFGVKYYRSSGC